LFPFVPEFASNRFQGIATMFPQQGFWRFEWFSTCFDFADFRLAGFRPWLAPVSLSAGFEIARTIKPNKVAPVFPGGSRGLTSPTQAAERPAAGCEVQRTRAHVNDIATRHCREQRGEVGDGDRRRPPVVPVFASSHSQGLAKMWPQQD
jgi:hypothetical protein